jgi:hypothetical protein
MWITDELARIYKKDSQNWVRYPGSAVAISAGDDGSVYTLSDYGQVSKVDTELYQQVFLKNAV